MAPNREAVLQECEQTFVTLRDGISHARTRSNLANLNAALQHLVRVGSVDFGPKNVTRALRQLGHDSPSESGIKNTPPEGPFRTLIAAYATKFAPTRVQRPDKDDASLDASIDDPQVRARVKWLQDELRSLRHRHQLLKGEFQRLAPMSVSALRDGGATTAPAAPTLSPVHVASVRRFLANAEKVMGCDWDAHGTLMTSSGMQVSGPGFRAALESLLGETNAAAKSVDLRLNSGAREEVRGRSP